MKPKKKILAELCRTAQDAKQQAQTDLVLGGRGISILSILMFYIMSLDYCGLDGG
jgi:hypothetical protein